LSDFPQAIDYLLEYLFEGSWAH